MTEISARPFLPMLWSLLPLFLAGTVLAADPAASVTTEPLLESCGLSLIAAPETTGVAVHFREAGSKNWREGFPMTKLPYLYPAKSGPGWNRGPVEPLHVNRHEWRSMLGELRENTVYELKLTEMPSGKSSRARFRTANPEIKIATTIYLDDLPAGKMIRIQRKGTPDGWIRYTVRNPEFVITDRGRERLELIRLQDAEYIILENLTLRGATLHAISLDNCSHIRIINCDIAGFSRVDGRDLEGDGKFFKNIKGKNRPSWNNAGISAKGCSHLLIERNYIHSPASSASSWFYSHTCGPMAVFIRDARGSTVVRYNDFIGSDRRRWDDALGGASNGSPVGGFNRNADIYGNLFFNTNDDGIEIDGGQSNVLIHRNRFECNMVGISTAPCIVGPSYLYRNLMVNPGDELGNIGTGIKNLFGDTGTGTVHAFNNLVWSINGGAPIRKTWQHTRCIGRNNLLYSEETVVNSWALYLVPPGIQMDHSLAWHREPVTFAFLKKGITKTAGPGFGLFEKPVFVDPERQNYRLAGSSPGSRSGVRIPNFIEFKTPDIGAFPSPELPDLPERPLPVRLDRGQIRLNMDKSQETVLATAETGFSSPFRIRINEGVEWFRVSPMKGILRGNTRFIVTLQPEKMQAARRYHDAFLIRFPNGLSRPVTVHADMRNFAELQAREKAFTLTVDATDLENGSNYPHKGDALQLDLRQKEIPLLWKFEVPADGIYYLFGLWETDGIERDLFEFSVDGDKMDVHRNPQMGGNNQIKRWRHIRRGIPRKDKYFEIFRLKKGYHELRLVPKRPLRLEQLGITDTPAVFFR